MQEKPPHSTSKAQVPERASGGRAEFLALLLAAGAVLLWPPAGAAPTASAPPSGSSAAATTAPADLVLLHGKIHTQDATRSIAEALALRGNTIVFVGSDAVADEWVGPGTRTIDLRGRVMLPGIIDAHTHPALSAQDLDKCSLEDKLVTPADVKLAVAQCLRTNPGNPTQWFDVVMVNPSGLSMTLEDLDSILADRPLLLNASDGHTVWANSAVLRAAHITAATADPAGGHIIHDAQGHPTGTLRDNATLIALAAEPPPSLAHEAAQLDKALDAMRATGITSVQDASVDDHWMRVYKSLYDAHRLNMRVRASLHLPDLHQPADQIIAHAKQFRSTWAIDPDFLRADAVKIFADGVIEYPSQTAALLEPYLDANGKPTENRGPSYFTQAQLNDVVSAAEAASLTVHIHAIGDRAVRSSLDAFAEARRRNGPRDNRNQIAHLELVDPADFGRFKELAVIANFQLLWAESEDYIERATVKYIGPERSRHLYPARSLRDAGAVIAGGSDWGVSSFDAFEAMEHGITRSLKRGAPPLLPEQGLTLQDMVDAYTTNAAFALKQERTTGSLEIGKRADFIILDRDIFALDPYDLHSTRVLATYLDGRAVYTAQSAEWN